MSGERRVRVTLPLNAEQRASLASWLAEYGKACDAARAEYDKAHDATWVEYNKTREAAWAEYSKARDAAWAEYNKTREAAWAEYNKTRDAAWAEYNKTREAAWAEYNKTRDASPLVSWIIVNFLGNREEEARDVLDALAYGADLSALRVLARDSGWCEVWDDALADADRLFDIEDAR